MGLVGGIGPMGWSRLSLTSLGSDPGRAILQASDAWVSARDSTITTVDVAGNINLRATPNFIFGWVKTNDVVGPDGELGVGLYESNGTTAAHNVRWNKPTNLSFGHLKCRRRYRATELATPDKFIFNQNNAPELPRIFAIPPSKYADPTASVGYNFTINNRSYAREVTFLEDNWLEFEHEGQWSAGGTEAKTFEQGVRTGAFVGSNALAMELASVEYEQKRVSQVMDVRDGTVRFSEASNPARQVLADDLWNRSRKCFVEAWGFSGVGFTPLTNAAVTPVSFAIINKCNVMKPATAGLVVKIGNIEIKAGTDGQWHIVQGATDVDTGAYVAAVQVCLGVRITGGTVTLFIDGQPVGTAAMTQGSTGLTLGGSSAEIMWESLTHSASTWSDADFAALSVTMRADAGLPESWPLDVWTGQSNAFDSASYPARLMEMTHGLKNCPGWAIKAQNFGVADSDWWNAFPNEYLKTLIGGNTGWFAEAQAAGDLRAMVMCSRGGTGIAEWCAGGLMQPHVEDAVAQAIARFGTHLVHVDTVIWWQGESDTANSTLAGLYESRFAEMRTWLRGEFGTQIKIVGVRLSEFVNTIDQPFSNEIRAAQDSIAASYDDVAYVTPTADPDDFADQVHYWPWAKIPVGKALYAARQTL